MTCPTGKIRVESKDPRVNYNLLPGEKLLTCPYNLSHALLPLKYAKHVLNCHRMHCENQKKLGKEPLFAICKHDRSHHVRKEEIAYHEANCDRRPKEEPEKEEEEEQYDEFGQELVKVKLQKPPEIGQAAVNAILEEENWDNEPAYTKTFDPDKRILECRKAGYSVIQAHKVMNLTPSEKREFYAKDAELMKDLSKQAYVNQLREKCKIKGINHRTPFPGGITPATSGRSSSTTSNYSSVRSTTTSTSSGASSRISSKSSVCSTSAGDMTFDDVDDEEDEDELTMQSLREESKRVQMMAQMRGNRDF